MGNGSALSAGSRTSRLSRLEAEPFDCLVIGGGITGAGIAREASRCGLTVALLEAQDFASGTSSRSSKLIHGGLRYLAQGEIALVRKVALERKAVRRLAPHLAEPAWMLVPSRSRASHLRFRTAIAAYEKLGAVDRSDRHVNWGPAELAENEPALNPDRYRYACVYREYTTDDARLVLANLRSAVAHGALVESRLRVDSLIVQGGRAEGAEATCVETGERIRVRAKVIVNAAGPWVSPVRELEDPDASGLLHLSKGIHVVIPTERLPVRNLVILPAGDNRSIFVVPRAEVVYVGTTDTSYGKGPEWWPEITRSDVEYLLQPLAQSLRIEPIALEECVAAWSGLRPLVGQAGRNPSEISRKDEIWEGAAGMISIAGGKLTGYRDMARGVVKRLANRLDRQLNEAPNEAPLPGGDFDGDLDALAACLARDYAIADFAANRLVRLYGTETAAVLNRGSDSLVPGAPVIAGEVDWAVSEEGALYLEDFIYRRSRVALYEPAWCDALLVPAARRMQRCLDWDDVRTEREVELVRKRRLADLEFASRREAV